MNTVQRAVNRRFRSKFPLPAAGLLALCFTGCRTHDFPQYPPNYREYVYVTNGGSDTVTVLDVVNVRIDRELPVGHNPVAVAASPTRNEIYVVNSGAPPANGSLSVIDAEHNAVVATIPLHRQPVSIDLKADGTLAYVANSGSNSVSVIDLKARRELAQIRRGRPAGCCAPRAGRQISGRGRPGRKLGDHHRCIDQQAAR